MERDTFVDRLKGYACFLVVFGHVIMGIRNAGIDIPVFFYGLEEFIWSFHVALFLFLSGYVYKITNGWKRKNTKTGFIKYKLVNLGVPYIVFSVVYILLNSFVGNANTQLSAEDILMIWKTPVAQYWFLYALFFLFCIWTVLSDMMKNWQITIFTVLLAYIAPVFGFDFGSFEVVIYSALAFGLGTFVDITCFKKYSITAKIIVIVLHIVLGIVFVHLGLIGSFIIKEIMMMLGIYASIMLISIAEEIHFATRFLEFMNKYSFQTYLLHTIFTAGIRIILIRLNITQWFVHILCGCVFGIMLSYIAAFIAKRTVVLDICFFPSSTFGKMRCKIKGRTERA